MACMIRHWRRRAEVAEARLTAIRAALVLVPPKTPPPTTIHILRTGVSLCPLIGVPGEWPEGHKWVSLYETEDLEKVNCGLCLLEKDQLGV